MNLVDATLNRRRTCDGSVCIFETMLGQAPERDGASEPNRIPKASKTPNDFAAPQTRKTATAEPMVETAIVAGRFLSDPAPMQMRPKAEKRLSIERQSVPVVDDRPMSVAKVGRYRTGAKFPSPEELAVRLRREDC